MFACKNYNMKARKNVLKLWDIFSLLGCNFYANKSGLNLIYALKKNLPLLVGYFDSHGASGAGDDFDCAIKINSVKLIHLFARDLF